MRQPRDFVPDRCYHLISRIANRAFYLGEDEPSFSMAGVQAHAQGKKDAVMRLLHHFYSTNGVRPSPQEAYPVLVGQVFALARSVII